MATPVYNPRGNQSQTGRMPYFWAVMITIGIFVILPLTQYITDFDRDRTQLTRIDASEPPPELPPPPPEEPPEEPPPEERPDVDVEPQQIDLTDLQVSLAAGTGGFGATFGLDFDAFGPSLDQMIFDVRDLDRRPRVIRQGRLEYPFEMRRERVEGFVRLKVIIDEQGRVRVAEVIEASHRPFVRPAIESAENSLFETPTKDGQAVRAYYYLPIRFSLRG